MRNVHGIYGGLTGRTRPDLMGHAAKAPSKDLVLKLPEAPNGRRVLWAPEGLELLTDGDEMYIVQRIPK